MTARTPELERPDVRATPAAPAGPAVPAPDVHPPPPVSSEAEMRATPGMRPHAQTLALVLLAVLGLGSFAAITWLLWSHGQVGFDLPLLTLARTWTAYTPEWAFLSDAANLPLVALGVGTVVWLFWRHQRREALLVILVLAAATAGSEAVKQLVARPRPPGSDTVVPGVIYSFPSGHVLESVTVLGIIAVLIWRSRLPLMVRAAFAIGVAIFVALVAVARVAINAHYPSDVLAGLLAGIGILAIFILLSAPHGRSSPDRHADA